MAGRDYLVNKLGFSQVLRSVSGITAMTAYYNENDAEKAAWIRELIRRNVVAPGDVDERSITDVRPDDLRSYTQCHFFAGIAVWSCALRLAGWPDDRAAWTGSCPCPSFSCAGKGEGFDDPRHLWPAWWPLIRECRPAIVFGEQVASAIRHGWWDLVSTDLESASYAAAAAVLTSAGVGAPDIRERLYWLAHAQFDGRRTNEQERRAQERAIDGRPSETLRLAGANERRPEQCDAGERTVQLTGAECAAVRLADSEHSGRDRAGRTQTFADSNQSGVWRRIGEKPTGSIGQAGEPSRMADANGGESRLGELQRSGEHGQQPPNGRTVERMDNSPSDGRESRPSLLGEHDGVQSPDGRLFVEHFAADALKGHWGTADWLFCTDGKWRPVEAGTFPLDHGAACRLGRLRGYGDAVNAEVAKAFIESCM